MEQINRIVRLIEREHSPFRKQQMMKVLKETQVKLERRLR